MLRSLVLGASGQIGRFLVPRLLDAGHDVLAVSRQLRESKRARLRWIAGDLFATMPELAPVDAIFSLGPLDGFAAWLAAARLHGTPRIIALGSMSIESKRGSTDPHERALVETLRRGEVQLAEAADKRGCAWTLLRPTLIYGAGIDRSLSALARFGSRFRVLPKVSFAKGLRQPVHADDLADACLSALGRDSARCRTFDLGGGERLGFAEMLERVRCSLPGPVLGVPLTPRMARLALSIARTRPRWRGLGQAALERLQHDLVADDAPARRDLAWAPRAFLPEASTWQARELD
ncbi:MAG TPA: NAD-dependent epimerase/dehydratase family protein [Dokdonella sp.]|uniref:NAD-dependent epimerase/dehydratase family protein n=1 Tax=Dokdonella sp. TaxID=2291710 RepID=UPI002BDDB326|nr:NAD-dependent epimerase/dehydratase family protein [Dokdonella sp.]HOX70703.1 NAD-dependent epimerase/dehydratase family protein [Dokdonella sp.]HPG93828.1 NAD-dependent epimerase/dehydratase family protein [Dokdonella sp.]HPN80175.1 NAD-dependent epimerase/dehydratase family protein [Dokdonella sp.]